MSSLPLFIPMIGFMFVAAITPGPNNIMLASSGANFGFRRTIPHFMGVTFGFFVLMLLVSLGLGVLFEQFPMLQQIFRAAALCFILYLAWRIANSGKSAGASKRARPINFIEAASFQLINPKGVVMAITVNATFISPDAAYAPQIIALVGMFTLLTLISVMSWAGFGLVIGRFIQTDRRQTVFNVTMAILLLVSIMPVAVDMLAQL